MIIIDEKKIFAEIKKSKPTSVALNAPDGLIHKTQKTASKIMSVFNIPAYVILDTTWGSCDLNVHAAKILSAGILFNIGHTINVDMLYGSVVMIDAFDDISFNKVAEKCIKLLSNKTIALSTNSQHLHQLNDVKDIFEKHKIKVKIGNHKGQLNNGQVFGCEFYTVSELSNIDSNVFLGQSNFHAAGIALSTNRPTYVLDPYFNEVTEITEFAQKLQRKAILSIYKAADANVFGIIIGLKEGQLSKITALKFKKELEKNGKIVQLFALTNITNDRLECLDGIEVFIQVACPRISIDNHFDRPVLSTPQANALLKILQNESIEECLQLPHWL